MWKECWIIEEFEAPRKVKTQERTSRQNQRQGGCKWRENPAETYCLYMAPKTPKLKRFSSLPKGWSPITPDDSHEPLDLGFLASPSWDAEYSEVLRNAFFVLK